MNMSSLNSEFIHFSHVALGGKGAMYMGKDSSEPQRLFEKFL